MRRAHRRWHLRLWLVLGPLVVLGLLLGWLMRPSVPVATAGPAASGTADGAASGADR